MNPHALTISPLVTMVPPNWTACYGLDRANTVQVEMKIRERAKLLYAPLFSFRLRLPALHSTVSPLTLSLFTIEPRRTSFTLVNVHPLSHT